MACQPICIAACDHLLLVTVVGPLVSMYWCGMFFLVDQYVIPSNYVISIWFTCVVGFGAVLLCHIEHENLTKLAHKDDVVYNPLARLYSILLIIIIVFQWRGFWYILEYYLPSGILSGALSIAAASLLLVVSGCCKSITGVVPFILVADDKTNYFVALSRFSHLTERHKAYRLIDHLYSVFFVHPSVILLWRGLWHIQDNGILVDDHVMSGIVSLGCGTAATLSLFLLQFPMNECVKTLSKVPRFFVEQSWRLVVVSAAVFYWRGTWVFFEIFFQKHVFTMWFITIMSAFLLCVLNVWSIATLRGEVLNVNEVIATSLMNQTFLLKESLRSLPTTVCGFLEYSRAIAILIPGVWVDDPLDSTEDGILFDIHYFRDIASVVKDSKIEPVFNEKYAEGLEPLKSKSDQVSILESGEKAVPMDSEITKISIHEWEKLRESDL